MTTRTTRPDFTALPPAIARLAVDARDYPVPWFVAWVAGPDGVQVPDHRVVDGAKLPIALRERRCWICGGPLGVWLAFPIGPMCAITRTISEPPSHRACAEWSIRHCPFLSRPAMTRRLEGLPVGHVEPAGISIRRNPGVTCLWMTRSFERFPAPNGGWLITVGSPQDVTWWCEGRAATRAEVDASITSGYPNLLALARAEGTVAVEMLDRAVCAMRALLPVECGEEP